MQWWQVLIAICSASALAGFAGAYWGRVFASSRLAKRISELETDSAVQASEFAKVLALTKKISQRVALDQHRQVSTRANRSSTEDAPPPGDKRAAREHYLRGKTHQQIALIARGEDA